MLLHKYLSRTSNIFSLNRMLLITMIGMVLVMAMMIQSINRQIEARTTVLVPLTATGVMEVGYDTASEDYLRAIARYIINLAFTYTADSAKAQFEELLTLFAPEQREAERRRWLAIAEKIEKVKRVSRTFFIDDIRKRDNANILVVKGTTARRLGKKLEIEPAIIELKYRIQYGRFLLEEMRSRKPIEANRRRIAESYITEVTGDKQAPAAEEGGAGPASETLEVNDADPQ